jgi:hypothetical protein
VIARGVTLAGLLAAAVLALVPAGCATAPAKADAERGAPPSYAEVAARYNERVEPLQRLWGSAVARLEYRDEQGRLRREQGEGVLQLIQPSRFALDVGKLGETLLWLGCDEQRYWMFELHEADRAQVGLHANLGRPCNRPAGLPAHPLDIIELLGVTPMPVDWPTARPDQPVGETKWSSDGRLLIVDTPARRAYRRLYLDPETYLPQRAEIYSFPERELVLFATLSEYERVRIRAGARPLMAGRIIIERPGEETKITLDLGSMTDGSFRADRLISDAFSFEALLSAYRPEEVIVLDAACPQSAFAAAAER